MDNKRTYTEDYINQIISESIKKVLSEKKVIKIPKKNASSVNQAPGPEPEPMPQQEPQGPAPDPNMTGADSIGQTSPDMGGEDVDAPMGDASMDNGGGSPEKEEIQKNIGKGCQQFRDYQGEDKADLKKWVEGMLDSLDDSESSEGEEGPADDNMPPMEDDGMPMEGSLITKKRLKKINEVFGLENMDKNNDDKVSQRKHSSIKNSPFNSPKFDK